MAGGNVGTLNIQITGDAHGLKGVLADARGDVGKTAGFFKSALSTGAGVVGAGIFTALTSGVTGWGKSLLMANANAEQLRVTLDIATGSAERSKMVFDTMQKMAAATPFEFKELAGGAARIESFGIDSTKVMTTIGDTAAGTMRSIDQVTNAYLDSGMGQFIRLQELGIDATTVGDQVVLKWVENGKTITKSVDKNNGLLIQSTVAAIWNSKYEGAMKKQSKTFLGQWSTLKDNWNLTMQRMTLGFFDFSKGVLTEGNQFFDLFNKKVGQGLSPVDAALSALHVTLDQVFGKTAGDIMDRTLRGIVGGIEGIVGAVGGLAGALVSGDIGGFFSLLGDDLKALAAGGIDLGVISVKAAFDIARDVPGNLWGWFVGKVMGTEMMVDPMTGAVSQVTKPVDFGTVLVTAGLKLGGVAAEVAGNFWGWLMGQLGVGSNGFAGVGDGTQQREPISLGDVVVDIAGWAAGTIADIAVWLKDEAKTAIGGALDLGVILIDGAPALAADIWGAVGGAAGWFKEKIKAGVGGTIDLGVLLLSGVPALAASIWGAAGDAKGWLEGQLGVTSGEGGGGIIGGAQAMLSDPISLGDVVVDAALKAGAEITRWAGDVWGSLKTAAGWVWDNKADIGTIALNIAGWGVESVITLAGAIGVKISGWWNEIKEDIHGLGKIKLNIPSWDVLEPVVTLAGALGVKISGWWNDNKDEVHALGAAIVSLASIKVQEGFAWAEDTTTTIQTWIDSNPPGSFITTIDLSGFIAAFAEGAEGKWWTAVSDLLESDPINVTPKIELNIQQSVTNWLNDFKFEDINWGKVAIGGVVVAAFLFGGWAAAIAVYLAMKVGPDILRALRGTFNGIMDYLVEGTDTFYAGVAGGVTVHEKGPLEGLLDFITGSFENFTTGIGDLTASITNPFVGFYVAVTGWIGDVFDDLVGWLLANTPESIQKLANGDFLGAVVAAFGGGGDTPSGEFHMPPGNSGGDPHPKMALFGDAFKGGMGGGGLAGLMGGEGMSMADLAGGSSAIGDMEAFGTDLATAVARGIDAGAPTVLMAMQNLTVGFRSVIVEGIASALSAAYEASGGFVAVGENIAVGIAAGIGNAVSAITNAAAAAVRAGENAAKAEAEVASPSRSFMRIGAYMAEGLALGMMGGLAGAQYAGTRLAMASLPQADYAARLRPIGGQGGSGSGGRTIVVNVTGTVVGVEHFRAEVARGVAEAFTEEYRQAQRGQGL